MRAGYGTRGPRPPNAGRLQPTTVRAPGPNHHRHATLRLARALPLLDGTMSVPRRCALAVLTALACGTDSLDGATGASETTDTTSVMTAPGDAEGTANPTTAGTGPGTNPTGPSSEGTGTTDDLDTSATDEAPGSDTTSAHADLGGTTSGRGSYCTDFPLQEDPISEAGAWSAISSPWLRVRTLDGIAKPDAYVSGYNDNYARLSGFGPDVEITATVYIADGAPLGELLLLARMDDTETTNRGYEFLYDGDGSVQLMRWNGDFGDFTPMGGESANPGPLQDLDQLRLRIEGSTITAYHRRPPADFVEIGQTIDDTWADGQPGMGFFVRDRGQTIDAIGFRDYCVEEI
jgi:hypothetical protein